MQIILFKKFCVLVSARTSNVDKLLRMLPDSILEVIFFKISWETCPRSPSVSMLRMLVYFAHSKCK